MYRIYKEYCNSKLFSRCCGLPGKWLKPEFVRPWSIISAFFVMKINLYICENDWCFQNLNNVKYDEICDRFT